MITSRIRVCYSKYVLVFFSYKIPMGVEVLTIKQTFINEAVCANVDEAAAGPMMDISPAQVKKIIEITNEYLSTFGCQRPPTT
jgi:hypothetical protein